ncbi:Predicted Peptidoglycan domain-containing protein [Cnuella takakiae]|uniref:Predicted Peptidoglycan domain-containing protein n=1 Tax=Cnuella takakiae TaxID=1302690 RepID=A0A1M5G1V1_9BACT|nr:glycosyl hydrolase 108 family protein [Cnuella takakiae]OLY92301.1 hypothetical protein BUE76_10645 [Cnuella takakiae]SHF97745.1 Predicted Peptidoglycan domain-containing protein [Cnuella takakiae]
MANFTTAYNATMGHEGAHSDNPKDRGGETWKGVARNFHPSWSGWAIIDACKREKSFPANLKTNQALEQMVRMFYKKEFWNRLSLENIQDQSIANEMFDTAVNCGPAVAGQFLQRALNVLNRTGRDYPNLVVDGQIGPKTVTVLNVHRSPADVLKVLNILQGNRYIEICEARETQETFTSGWLKRVSLT